MKKPVSFLLLFSIVLVLLPIGAYLGGAFFMQLYINAGATNLLSLEKQGRLSRRYGYVWQEIQAHREMNQTAASITGKNEADHEYDSKSAGRTVDFPSLAAVAELNNIKSLHKTIRINDRNYVPLVELKTTHTSIKLSELNEILLKSLITTEDQHFYSRKNGYDYHALLRASLHAALISLRTLKLQYPRGSSTIHMQVARFLLMRYNNQGYAYAEKSISRKINELKLAQALSIAYSKEEILTLYINHCVSAGRGMVGYHDISMGLFGVTPERLSIPQSLYLARLVKWNRHVPEKIIRQIKASLPALAESFRWSSEKQQLIREQLDSLSFRQPSSIIPPNSYIIDLANEYLRKICELNGMHGDELDQMDISNPESMIRRYGNLSINLTIDYRLQKLLERVVSARGFGQDTTIRTDIRIGSDGRNLESKTVPPDTLRRLLVIAQDSLFRDTTSAFSVNLQTGDTLVSNIRYRKLGPDSVRRSCFYYKRDSLRVPGQYYAYALMDSRTNELLAYCSKDRLGSRLQSLLVNKNPNGSSVAKPIIYGLAFDLGIYGPSDMGSDNQEYPDSCLWARTYLYKNKEPVGMVYLNVPEHGGYPVRNHNRKFEGYDFLYNHLSYSNNIVAVETMYRLMTAISDSSLQSKNVKALLERLGRDDLLKLKRVTGPQLFAALVSSIRNEAAMEYEKISRKYSIALGTLELSLYEQMHLFNILYGNTLVVTPERYPSLFIKSVQIAGENVSFSEGTKTYTVFSDLRNIRPAHLAMHKRLLSNSADNLSRYDICFQEGDKLSNFAKSGTTDDVIRPFNADITDTTRTNYGLWNAVLRLQLKREDLLKAVREDTLLRNYAINPDSVPVKEVLDVTVACIGECNKQYTGDRDGKSLHGYVTRELLHAFGIPCSSGFYRSYEEQLQSETRERDKYASDDESDLSFLSRALITVQAGIGTKAAVDELRFEKSSRSGIIRLAGKNYRKMLKFAPYMGENSRKYHALLNKLKKLEHADDARGILSEILSLEVHNKVLKRDLERACSSLLRSLEQIKE